MTFFVLECDHFQSITKPITRQGGRGASVIDKRDIFHVSVGENMFVVGKQADLTLSHRSDRSSHLQTNYLDTPQHMALFRGGLLYLGLDEIDLLVTGLPVDHYDQDHQRMREKLKGLHEYPDGKHVMVKDVWVLPQPVGGFVDYFTSGGGVSTLNEISTLTIDIGYYTVDWVTCRGMGMQEERSGSVPAGMSLILDKLCELISQDLSYTFTRINLIDEGIRNNFRMKIQGEIYDFSHLIPKIDDHILASIQSISRSVGNVDDIDNVLLVGGGAKCYQSIIERLIKHRNIVIRDNSIYSNVKGFYIAGRERAASQNKMGV